MSRDPDGIPECACVPDAIAPEVRAEHFARIRRLFGGASRDRTPLTDGYEFTFDVSELGELATFVSLERLCCPFLSFELEIRAGSDDVRLQVQGPPGARGFVEAELLDRGAGP